MSGREQSVTPRSLAAILNPDVERPPAATAASAAERLPDETKSTGWQDLRQRVLAGGGTLELLLFRVAGEYFAIPLDSVREALDSVEWLHLPEMPSHVHRVLSYKGSPLPVFTSIPFLGVASVAPAPSVLIVKGARQDAGLAVDEFIGSAQVHADSVRRVAALEDESGAFVGVFFHGSQLVALVDPSAFMRGGDQ